MDTTCAAPPFGLGENLQADETIETALVASQRIIRSTMYGPPVPPVLSYILKNKLRTRFKTFLFTQRNQKVYSRLLPDAEKARAANEDDDSFSQFIKPAKRAQLFS